MAGREQVERFAQALSDLSTLAKRDLGEFFTALDFDNPAAMRDALLEFYPQLVAEYGDMGASIAADWYDEVREEMGVAGGYRAGLADNDLIAPEKRVRSAARHMWADDPNLALQALSTSLDRFVKQPARDTIISSAAKDPAKIRYARVPRGATTCDFCLMLASRGAVYHTNKTAGEFTKFHGNCDCQIVPIRGEADYPEGYDPDALYEQYKSGVWETSHPLLPESGWGNVGTHPLSQVDEREMQSGRRLARCGLSPFFRERVERDGVKNPDLSLWGTVWELKAPKGGGKNNISKQFRRAKEQAARMVLDLSWSPLDEGEVVREVRRRVKGHAHLREVLVIKKDGSLLRFTQRR